MGEPELIERSQIGSAWRICRQLFDFYLSSQCSAEWTVGVVSACHHIIAPPAVAQGMKAAILLTLFLPPGPPTGGFNTLKYYPDQPDEVGLWSRGVLPGGRIALEE